MDLVAISSLVIMSTYVTGFLSINAHLSKYGIHDFDLTNSRYMIVGIQFAAYLSFWYFPGGRHFINPRSKNEILSTELMEKNGSLLWNLALDTYRIANPVFLLSLSAASFSWIFFSSQDYIEGFFLPLLFDFMVQFSWEHIFSGHKFPKITLSILLGTRLFMLTVYFHVYGIFSTTNLVLFTFLLLTFVLWFVRSFPRSYNRFELSIQASVFALICSIQFGFFHYGNINTSLGGGNSQHVEIVVNDQFSEWISSYIIASEKQAFEARILHENTKYVFLIIGEDIVRLPHDAINMVRFPCAEINHFIIDLPKNPCS